MQGLQLEKPRNLVLAAEAEFASVDGLKNILPNRVLKRRVRAAAIRRVRKDLILHSKSEHELSSEDLEYLVADAELAIKNDLKQAGILGILALVGINVI